MARTAHIVRETSESHIDLELNLDGTGKTDIDTSVPFYNHMMTALGKHSLIDLTIKATPSQKLVSLPKDRMFRSEQASKASRKKATDDTFLNAKGDKALSLLRAMNE